MKYYSERLQVKVKFLPATDIYSARISIKGDELYKIFGWRHDAGNAWEQAIPFIKAYYKDYYDVSVVGIVEFGTYYVLLLDKVLTKKGE